MDCSFTKLAYKETGYFTPIITDYLDGAPALEPFYQHKVSLQGFADAIKARAAAKVDRDALVQHLREQYAGMATSELVDKNISALAETNTFTVITAHQPALFTGTLYFIYKIFHTIRLAAFLNEQHPGKSFVPVYWMGSEDADLDELGKFYLGTEKIVWETKQKGAVGKMNTRGLDKLIHRIHGELSVLPNGKELVDLLKSSYLDAPDIQTATFRLLNTLFAEYGLVVLIPDTAILKKQMIKVFEEDLFQQTPSQIVSKTITDLGQHYKVQANPREINLFYLKGDIRERIVHTGNNFVVHGTDISFTDDEIRNELKEHPERFSPNVILRGLYQETILPNIAFIGGGGETAYWLELKDLFDHYKVPFPVLVLRNSFLFVEKKWQEKIRNMGFTIKDFFRTEEQLLTDLVARNKNGELKLANEIEEASRLYSQLKTKASVIDKSLQQHVDALQARALKPLQELEKKMLRAEKRKYEAEQRQIHAVKSALFPRDGLQERIDNFMPYYAKWGKEFLDVIYNYSLPYEQEFVVLEEK
jgi:bacillithiol synthase